MALTDKQVQLNEARKVLDRMDRADEKYLVCVAKEHKALLEGNMFVLYLMGKKFRGYLFSRAERNYILRFTSTDTTPPSPSSTTQLIFL